jgi:hypothetical protein
MADSFDDSKKYRNFLSMIEKRQKISAFFLVELDPLDVLITDHHEIGYMLGDVRSAGYMRETCPVCKVHLRLALRQKGVKREFIFCHGCGRCFDAFYANGVSAFLENI